MKTLIVSIAVIAALPTPSDACSKRHQTPFELFAEAVTVAVVNVRKTPSGTPKNIVAGDVELAVTRVIKGTQTKLIIAKENETSCRARYIVGTDALVLLRADGLTVGAHDGHLRDPVAWAPVLEAWAQATDDDARVRVLVDAIEKPEHVATEAIDFLVDQPALLDLVTAEQTSRIAAAAKKLPKDPTIVMLLVRLRSAAAPSRANVALWATAARGVLAVKLAERDPEKLAAMIAKGRRDGDPRRVAAMERCERVHGKPIAPFGRYFGGAGSRQMWAALAEACRTGTAI